MLRGRQYLGSDGTAALGERLECSDVQNDRYGLHGFVGDLGFRAG